MTNAIKKIGETLYILGWFIGHMVAIWITVLVLIFLFAGVVVMITQVIKFIGTISYPTHCILTGC